MHLTFYRTKTQHLPTLKKKKKQHAPFLNFNASQSDKISYDMNMIISYREIQMNNKIINNDKHVFTRYIKKK